MRISDWSSDVCSSDLPLLFLLERGNRVLGVLNGRVEALDVAVESVQQVEALRLQQFEVVLGDVDLVVERRRLELVGDLVDRLGHEVGPDLRGLTPRSEENTSELQSLMRISYAVFCLKKKT